MGYPPDERDAGCLILFAIMILLSFLFGEGSNSAEDWLLMIGTLFLGVSSYLWFTKKKNKY